MKTKFSLLDILKIRSSDQIKMFAISTKNLSLSGPLAIPYKKLLTLCFGRVAGLRNRVNLLQKFTLLVIRLRKNHGADFTIKWLKACYVVLQKAQAGDNLNSLRELEPDLPMPRLINGLPAFIIKADRTAIKEGHVNVIRFWSSLFSIYRILKCSYKLKTSTITDPFIGDRKFLSQIKGFARETDVFMCLPGHKTWSDSLKLSPRTFIYSSKASPSSKISWQGLYGEIWALITTESGNAVLNNIRRYTESLERAGFANPHALLTRIDQIYSVLSRLGDKVRYTAKQSSASWWGQLSLKEEAAGKLRVFALVDCVTQSVLAPLHESLFQLLRLIPNDGTFDQTASISRSCRKAAEANCAFSFDLSAATDRLPATLTADIISNVLRVEGLGDAWLALLVERNFHLTEKTMEKYIGKDRKLWPWDGFRYSVGQPMGALSSWAGLAITHHFIVQYCSLHLPGRVGWEDRYEILGDDLVIFHKPLADEYLRVMRLLGVEINLTKSIVSPSKPVFEFAKRTMNYGNDVSPIPFKQLLGISLSDRIGQYLSFAVKGLLGNYSVLRRVLSRFGVLKLSLREFGHPILAILGALTSQKLIPHRWLVESVIEPGSESLDEVPMQVPLQSSLKLILEVIPLLRKKVLHLDENLEELSYPWSSQDSREEVYDDWEPEFANVIVNRAVTLAKKLERDYDNLIANNSLKFFADPRVVLNICASDPGLRGALIGLFEDNLIDWNKGFDVGEIVDELMDDPKIYYRRDLSIDHAQSALDRVEKLYNAVSLAEPKESMSTILDSAGTVMNLKRVIGGSSTAYWDIQNHDGLFSDNERWDVKSWSAVSDLTPFTLDLDDD